jgi:hypothetical protein
LIRLESTGVTVTRDRIAVLTLEALTFAYFCAIVVDFFAGRFNDEALEGSAFKQAGSSDIFERLTKGRQALAVHPVVAWEGIFPLRGDCRLE